MKSKTQTSTQYSKTDQDFINQQMSKEAHLLEVVVFFVLAILLIRWTGKVLVAFFSRTVFINKPNFQKAVFTKDSQHLIGRNRNAS